MNQHRKTSLPPTYRRVTKRNKKVTYLRQTKGGRIKFLFSELFAWIKAIIRSLFWSRKALAVFASILVTMLIFAFGVVIYFSATMPNISSLVAAKEQAGVEILASDGSVINHYGQISGKYIPYDQLPKNLIDAVIATEDRRFFKHNGVDVRGIFRAVFVNIAKGKLSQGGSSITQQLAKNLFFSGERTLKRKVQELMMAFWLESKFTKQEIISVYLNRVYFGAGNYGVDSAARYYFNKQAGQMNLSECAMLAGLLKAPSKYNPTADLQKTIGRTTQVIANMVDADMLSNEVANAEIARLQAGQMQLKQRSFASERYFSDWVYEKLPEYLGEELREDVVVQTTFDSNIQNNLQAAIVANLSPQVRQSRHVSQSAGIVMRPDGAVLAMVGGIDYNNSQYNRATQAKRQAGSIFKLFVYLAAMEHGYTPDVIIEDAPFNVGKWSPQNYKDEYLGAVSLQQAFALSLNTVAVRLSQYVGIKEVARVAKRLGVRSDLNEMPSLALGAADVTLKDMVTAYAHLANGGRAVMPYGITRVTRKADGGVIYARNSDDDFNDIVVVKSENIAKMNVLMMESVRSGTSKAANIGRDVAGKTGTTSDYRDAWFMGYSPQLVAGIWVGNDDNSKMSKVTGGSIPARIWADVMRKAHSGLEVKSLPIYQPIIDENQMVEPIEGEAVDPNFELEPSFWDKLLSN